MIVPGDLVTWLVAMDGSLKSRDIHIGLVVSKHPDHMCHVIWAFPDDCPTSIGYHWDEYLKRL